jgi:hypothetical protein
MVGIQGALAAIQAQQATIQAQQGLDGAALVAIQAQQVAIQAQLAAIAAIIGAPVLAANRIAIARAANKMDDPVQLFVAVPTAAGVVPPAWPAGFNRTGLRNMTGVNMDAFLLAYGLPAGGTGSHKRNLIAGHIGTTRF